MIRYCLYILSTVHDHAHLENIYTRVVVFGIGIYLINFWLDIELVIKQLIHGIARPDWMFYFIDQVFVEVVCFARSL